MIISGKIPIAMFDILGFRSRIVAMGPNMYSEILDNLKTMSIWANPAAVDGMFFSDTIVLYGNGKHKDFEGAWVAEAASSLLALAARMKYPIRGALSFGDMYIDTDRNYIVGAPLVRLYDLEKQQEWMGAVVDKEYEKYYSSEVEIGCASECLVRYPAPMKVGPRDKWYCVGWTHRLESKHILSQVFNGYEQDHDVYRKYKNTLEFFNDMEVKRFSV